jgi:hypothetical protein
MTDPYTTLTQRYFALHLYLALMACRAGRG